MNPTESRDRTTSEKDGEPITTSDRLPIHDGGDKPESDSAMGLLLEFLRFYFRHTGWRAYASIGQQLLLTVLSGIGILMLIPLLYIVGVGGNQEQSGVMGIAAKAVESVGLSLNLATGLSAFVMLISLHAIFQYRQAILQTEIIEEFSRHLRHRMYEAMARARWIRIVGIKSSRIHHTINADVGMITTAAHSQQSLVGLLLLLAANIAIAFYLSVAATLISLACGGLLLLLLRPLSTQVRASGEKRQDSWRGIYAAVTDHLAGLKVAKSYGLENAYINRFDGLGRDVVDATVSFTRTSEKARIFQGIGVAVALSVFVYFGVEVIALPIAELILLIFLFSRLLPQFSSLLSTWHRLLHSLPSLKDYRAMYRQLSDSMEPEFLDDQPAMRLHEAVHLENVSFSYESETAPALSAVNLHIPAQKMTAIVGSSGAGKSTLADLLIGVLQPVEGRIVIDAEPLTRENIHLWRKAVGYVPQETFLFHDTIRSNMMSGRKDATDADLEEALTAAAASYFVHRLPEGMDTLVGDRGVRLSGGERQRIALARALIRKPALLLLDEATSALDTENETRIQEAIDRLQGELTIVVIAHRLSTVRNADLIVVLDNGRVVEQGTWAELLSVKEGVFQKMVRADESVAERSGVSSSGSFDL